MAETAISRLPSDRPPLVCVQGLGFVGAAMCLALASARDATGAPCYRVAGLELDTPLGRERATVLDSGRFPFAAMDPALAEAAAAAHATGTLAAGTDPEILARADVIVVNVGLDVETPEDAPPRAAMAGFLAGVREIARRMRPNALVVIETTVPPGTTSRVVAPLLAEGLAARGLPADAFLLAHAYERVMPGPDYLRSITHFWRCYAGHTEAAAATCADFLARFIDTVAFPLTRLSSTVASETAKIMENSYRAVTIAMMEEWGRFAEAAGIDLFEVIDAIRMRPTHANMRTPGFGVGGYCLTKDPLFAGIAARDILGLGDMAFPFAEQAVAINAVMPLVSVTRIAEVLGGLDGKRLLLMGVSYRGDVADTRSSASADFLRAAEARGATVTPHDPLVREWPELGLTIAVALPDPAGFDAVVMAVDHRAYRSLDFPAWLGAARPLIFDANRVLSAAQRASLAAIGAPLASIGRGDDR